MTEERDRLVQGATPSKGEAPLEPTVTLPRKDARRVFAPGEEGERKALLEAVTVDNRGVAHGLSSDGTETMLVAVRINDEKQASVVPFEVARDLDREPIVQFSLPADTPSRVGFFLGWEHPENDLSAAIRAGLYPGTPLITQAGEYSAPQEIMLGLRGIKIVEEQEGAWAQQVGLFTDLGFDPKKCRGFFDRFHRADPSSTSWEAQPLLMIPRAADADYQHFDRQQVEGNTLQVLYYANTPKPIEPLLRRSMDDFAIPSFGLTRGITKGGDLGLAFGRATAQRGETTAVAITSLEGAFRVVAIPHS